MNEVEYSVCERILSSIFKLPICRFFWHYTTDVTNPNIAHPFSLSWICDRLSRGKYSSPVDVVGDIRACLQNGRVGAASGSIRAAAAQQLLLELDSAISTFRPSGPSVVLRLQFHIADYEDRAELPGHAGPPRREEVPPASEIFKRQSNLSDVTNLVRDIKFLSSSILAARLAVLVQKLQPGAVTIGDDVAFYVGIMTERTRRAARQYVTALLSDAATGKIDPFARPFGVKLGAVRIQERGITWRPARLPLPPDAGDDDDPETSD
jgi:hypothetical protein